MAITHRGAPIRCVYVMVAAFYHIWCKLLLNKKCGLIILCYHGVTDIQLSKFRKQIDIIKGKIVSLRHIDRKKLNKNSQSICLTFDDAFFNLAQNVIPFISAKKIPITIFVPTGDLGKVPSWLKDSSHSDKNELILSAGQIRKLEDNNLVLFGSHTVDHRRLSELPVDEIRNQLRSSANTISALTGRGKVKELALPHGDYNDTVINIALEEGYSIILTLDPFIISSDDLASKSVFGRFSVSPETWWIEYVLIVNGAYQWLYSWRKYIKKFFN